MYFCRPNVSFLSARFVKKPVKANEVSILDLKTISIVSHAKEIGSPIPGKKMKEPRDYQNAILPDAVIMSLHYQHMPIIAKKRVNTI